ncbi:MAG TPA: BTAD domain-containing putative transcriptional regulator, partial [Acidimicrobiales bacterium]|nr:BTAD domain-containing putative transcriptional regulator [Acidimicrobiales bacterium]
MRARVQVLGAVAVTVGDETTTISSPSQRVVLSVLAARADRDVPTDLLVEALWPDAPPRTAVSSLRTYVSRLRGLLGDALVGTPGGYRLAIDEVDLDLLRFERLLDDAATAPPARALDLIDEALAMWRGPPFGDVGDVESIRPVAVRLEERWVTARE